MGILSEETKEFIAEVFAAADADASGTIDAGEIHAVMGKIAEREGFDGPSQEQIQARLDELPTENEGALTLPEFMFLIGAIKVMTICALLFEAADTDASGVLESSEIKNVLTKLHEDAGVEPPSDEDMDAMIESVGGEVTLEQFASVVIPLIIEAAGDPVIKRRGILSDETKAFISELFAAADADGSGTIDAGEIHTVVDKIAEKEGFTAPSKEQIQARLDGLPTENEGALTLPEFMFLIGAIKVMTICALLFEAADTDASGVLESSEIKNVLTTLHENAGVKPPSDEDMDAMIESVGGEVTLEQFASVVIPLIIQAAGDPIIE